MDKLAKWKSDNLQETLENQGGQWFLREIAAMGVILFFFLKLLWKKLDDDGR